MSENDEARRQQHDGNGKRAVTQLSLAGLIELAKSQAITPAVRSGNAFDGDRLRAGSRRPLTANKPRLPFNRAQIPIVSLLPEAVATGRRRSRGY